MLHLKYKLRTLMFDVYHDTAPSYTPELCKSDALTDSCLHSAAYGDLIIPLNN